MYSFNMGERKVLNKYYPPGKALSTRCTSVILFIPRFIRLRSQTCPQECLSSRPSVHRPSNGTLQHALSHMRSLHLQGTEKGQKHRCNVRSVPFAVSRFPSRSAPPSLSCLPHILFFVAVVRRRPSSMRARRRFRAKSILA